MLLTARGASTQVPLETVICSKPSNLPPASQRPAPPRPSTGVLALSPLSRESCPATAQKSHITARPRIEGKMEPIILIRKGWEMAFAFQHEMCLKISCEFQAEAENSCGNEQSSVQSGLEDCLPSEKLECHSQSRGPGHAHPGQRGCHRLTGLPLPWSVPLAFTATRP